MAKAAAQQPSLFELAPELPEGMLYRPDFVTPDEEAELAGWLATLAFEPFQFRGYEGRRQVVSFGWKYDFNRTHLEKADDLPPELVALQARAAALAGHRPQDLQQVLINKYEPGAPIGWHRDRPVFEDVIGVSLGSLCTFRFRRKRGPKWERYSLTAEPRSVYLMRGSSRWDWEHSIPAVEDLRYSVTFRSLRAPRPTARNAS